MHLRRSATALLLLLVLAACQQAQPEPPVAALPPATLPAPEPEPDLGCVVASRYVQEGVASWYGRSHHGRRTASGEIFNMNAPSGAHRILPFGTLVRVTNLENGRAIDLRINDRGPQARARLIDLSHRAALALGFADSGTARVRVETLETC